MICVLSLWSMVLGIDTPVEFWALRMHCAGISSHPELRAFAANFLLPRKFQNGIQNVGNFFNHQSF